MCHCWPGPAVYPAAGAGGITVLLLLDADVDHGGAPTPQAVHLEEREIYTNSAIGILAFRLGAAAYQLGNTSSHVQVLPEYCC